MRAGDAVIHERFNVHASVTLGAFDDAGRERLCRYLSRPAFSLPRLRMRRDGMVVYQVKKRGRGRVLVRVMTPVECLARLAALVPPPRYPLLRLHGVLAARHAWRDRIVPVPRSPVASRPPLRDPEKKVVEHPRKAHADREAGFAMPQLVQTADLTASGLAHTTRGTALSLSVAHWARILDGELYAATSRVDWATLVKRTFACDVAVCPNCGGKMRVRAVMTEPASIAKVLSALRGDGARAPPSAA